MNTGWLERRVFMSSMKSWMFGAALVAGGLGLAATPAHAAQWGVFVGAGGPAAYVPPSPGPGYAWVNGYYNNGYWVQGYWNRAGDQDGYYRREDGDRGYWRGGDDGHDRGWGNDRGHWGGDHDRGWGYGRDRH